MLGVMRSAMLAVLLVVLSAVPAQARTKIGRGKIVPAAGGCTAANYASLPAGEDDGTICQATDTGLAWAYDTTTGLWLPPGVNPSSLVVDYTGAALPPASTPAWTKTGTESASVSGGILTISDAGASTCYFSLVDATNFTTASNIVYLMRARVTAQAAGTDGYKVFMSIRAGTVALLAQAYAATIGAAANVQPANSSGGTVTSAAYTVSMAASNANWNDYILIHYATGRWAWGVLGGALDSYDKVAFGGGTSYHTDKSVMFGSYSSAGTGITVEYDWIKVANF